MKRSLISDDELVIGYINGDDESLKIIIVRHKQKIFTSIYLLVKDHYLAEDIFQDTFMKVIDTLKQGKYEEQGKFLPWVMRIARNLVLDHFRRRQKMPTLVDSEGHDVMAQLPVDTENQETQLIAAQTAEHVRRLIQELPDEQREVLVLRHYANMSFKEIAELTGANLNTTLGRMRYALLTMRKLIEKYNLTL